LDRTQLVERAQGGDREAFDALATSLYDRLYAIGRRILRDADVAEDAVQDALIKAWRDLRGLREPDRFDAWMYRLLVRACHDQVRGRRRFDVEIHAIHVDSPDPEDEFGRVAHRDELERAFETLPFEQRVVLVLTHYVGMPAPEVARILGIPSGTVYSRLHYGTQAMRAALSLSPAAAPAQLIRRTVS
jgi:RNA polymerase sigma-70 factor (ECF subfamily)